MADKVQTNQVLVAILEMLKQQTVYLHRQHGWMIALAEAIGKDSALEGELKRHPFFDQGPREDEQITRAMLQNIDALIEQLKE